jgi:hypothetical protein
VTDIAVTYLHVEAALPPKSVCGLQFSVLLSVAVRLATLLVFMDCWGTVDKAGLPLAWLRFQMHGGHALFMSIGLDVKRGLFSEGKTTVMGISDTVRLLWREARTKLALSTEAVCPVVVDEAQVLANTDYPHVDNPKVLVPL